MLTSSLDVMKRNNLTVDQIDWFVPHQANLRIIEAVGGRIGVPTDKVLVNIQHRGNTSAASIPLCLDENKDKLKKRRQNRAYGIRCRIYLGRDVYCLGLLREKEQDKI